MRRNCGIFWNVGRRALLPSIRSICCFKKSVSITSWRLNTFNYQVKNYSQFTFQQQDKRDILVIYTGGTMGMIKNSDGALQPSPGYLTQQLLQMEELKSPIMPNVDVVE